MSYRIYKHTPTRKFYRMPLPQPPNPNPISLLPISPRRPLLVPDAALSLSALFLPTAASPPLLPLCLPFAGAPASRRSRPRAPAGSGSDLDPARCRAWREEGGAH